MNVGEAQLMVFDDGGPGLGPLTRRRASFELRSGAVTTLERIEAALGRRASALRVPERLVQGVGSRWDRAVNEPLDAEASWLAVHGRWSAVDAVPRVAALEPGRALTWRGTVVAARLEAGEAERVALGGELPESVARDELSEPPLYDRPWDLVRALASALSVDLERFDYPALPAGHVAGLSVVGDFPVRAHPSARVLPAATFDATGGPIVIDERAELRPFVAIQGPAYVGTGTVVGAFTSLRANTSVGPDCRVGGEISASVIQGLSNKAHAGYLGNAYVGEWCNLGADTTVSNLKNTYGSIRMQLEPGDDAIDTGLTHQGPVLGDVVRTAIGTLIPTGACLDLGSSIAARGFAPKYCPPFSWVDPEGSGPYELERFLTSLRLAMGRRGVELPAHEAELLRALHAAYAPPAGG